MDKAEYKDILADMIAYAQEGYISAFAFLFFTNGGRLLAEAIGLPFHVVWTLALYA